MMKGKTAPDPLAGGRIKEEISQALVGLEFGQVVIQIKDGKVTQIDRTEKRRLPRLEGLYGEGI